MFFGIHLRSYSARFIARGDHNYGRLRYTNAPRVTPSDGPLIIPSSRPCPARGT
jgi:hypothetical protein